MPLWRGVPLPLGLRIYVGVILGCGLVHAALGTRPDVLLLGVSAALMSLAPACVYGWRDMPSLLTMLLGMRYASSALIAKIVMFEPLDVGLYAPLESFIVVWLGLAAATVAAFAAHALWRGAPVFRERYSRGGLQLLMVAGVATLFGSIYLSFSGTVVLGGISALCVTGYALLPSAWAGFNLSNGKTFVTKIMIVSLIALSVLLVGTNSRFGVMLPFAAIAAMAVCFRIRVSPRYIVIGMIFGMVYAFIVAPIMTLGSIRGIRVAISPAQIVTATAVAISNPQSYQLLKTLRVTLGGGGRYDLHYIANNNSIERVVNVQQLDFSVNLANRYGTIGLDRFWRGLIELGPSFAVGGKPINESPSYSLWVYGIFDWGQEYHVETTTFGDAFVYGGYGFVAAISFVGYFLLYMMFRIFCPVFENSILAVTLLVTHIADLTAVYVLGLFMIELRQLPFEFALIWLATGIRRRLW